MIEKNNGIAVSIGMTLRFFHDFFRKFFIGRKI